jgi:hypothetical protein
MTRRRTRSRLVGTGLILLFLANPLAALACPNCYASSDTRVLHTYYLSAFILTLLPFAIIGAILFIARRVGRASREPHGNAPVAVVYDPTR